MAISTRFYCCFFFFQAEDGIRDDLVTGVQTCALPIWALQHRVFFHEANLRRDGAAGFVEKDSVLQSPQELYDAIELVVDTRVGTSAITPSTVSQNLNNVPR